MKKRFLKTLMLCLIGGSAFAQQNGGVELWDSILATPAEPQKWITVNLFKAVDATNPVSVTRITGTNAAAGTTSMKIKTVHLNTNPSSGLVPDDVGIAMQGTVTFSPGLGLIDRVPYTARPLNFHFVYQYKPVGIDTGFVYVELTKWNTSLLRRDTIATMGWYYNTLVNSWTTITLPMYYWPNHPSTMTPDSLAIVFSSSSYVAPQINSEFWADDCYFTGWNSTNDIYSRSSSVKAFPNPAKDNITISADLDRATSVIVYDGIGQVVGKFEMSNKKYVMNTAELKAGNYYFSIMDKAGVVISGNTFTVVK